MTVKAQSINIIDDFCFVLDYIISSKYKSTLGKRKKQGVEGWDVQGSWFGSQRASIHCPGASPGH